jgi:hypothetical protein
MANDVTNKIKIKLDKGIDAREFLKTIQSAYPHDGSKYFDFDKIIPEPEALIQSGKYVVSVGDLTFNCIDPDWDGETIRDWRIENWGCKWNSTCNEVNHVGVSVIKLEFITPWACPFPVLRALSKMEGVSKVSGTYQDEFESKSTEICMNHNDVVKLDWAVYCEDMAEVIHGSRWESIKNGTTVDLDEAIAEARAYLETLDDTYKEFSIQINDEDGGTHYEEEIEFA